MVGARGLGLGAGYGKDLGMWVGGAGWGRLHGLEAGPAKEHHQSGALLGQASMEVSGGHSARRLFLNPILDSSRHPQTVSQCAGTVCGT